MSIYTTPLQLGYFFSLLLWLVLLVRGYQERRLSDRLLGWVMFILAMELQDYTFGFAGINVLWNELNGFPRGVSLLFGPVAYLYFRAQLDRGFRVHGRLWLHFLPYALYFLYGIIGFAQGAEGLEAREGSSFHLGISYLMRLGRLLSFVYYLSACLRIYRQYREWSQNQFSNTELIGFHWFRDFVYAMVFWLLFREVMNVLDAFLDLDFYQDWWWNLALVAVSFYIGLAGYAQKQPAKLFFNPDSKDVRVPAEAQVGEDQEKVALASRLEGLMKSERLYLQADLSLQELAQHLNVSPAVLSASINQVLKRNFNDYINGLRVDEFIRQYRSGSKQNLTLLAIAMDSGFNSKATFNRAFKKYKGSAPKEFFASSS